MTNKLYGDEDLAELRSMPKRGRTPGAQWSTKPGHKQRNFQASGQDEARSFSIYQRQNLIDEQDFSSGITYIPQGGSRLTLARYNGPSHRHGIIAYSPHIHSATSRAIAAGKKTRVRGRRDRPFLHSQWLTEMFDRRLQPRGAQAEQADQERLPLTLDADLLKNLLCERLCEDVGVDERPNGEFMLRTHFTFPDGDGYPFHLAEEPAVAVSVCRITAIPSCTSATSTT